MQKDIFDRIIGFLLGASWAVVLFGALLTFKTFIVFGFWFSLFLTFISLFLSLFIVLAIDAFSVNRKRLQESKKQTILLERLLLK
ncbi:MAG: hypothetical protein JJW00_07530 [Sulfurimonas sp.]|nr:hypothetical protein [Sulfurimonas sp.]